MKKPGTFPQGTQRIARIGEICEPNAYVLEPAPPLASEQIETAVEGALTDAEIASAMIGGDTPVVARARRVTSAYANEAIVARRPILTVA